MKQVEILISNQNSYEAIQLCIESIRHYTNYPNYKIIVYDDCSKNNADLLYLREKQKLGWLKLIEGKNRIDHGGALNVLLNERCQADLAMILDCDIQILAENWLSDMVEQISQDEKVIAICNAHNSRKRGKGVWLAPFAEFWFGMINMVAYRNNMQIDWRFYYTADKKQIKHIVGDDVDINTFERLAVDVGSKLPLRLKENNPRGYYIKFPIPKYIENKYHHYGQISGWYGDNSLYIKEHLNKKFKKIRNELDKLRQ